MDLPANIQAMLLMLLSSMLIAGMHLVVKHVSLEIHPFEVFFLRQFFGLMVILPWFLRIGFSALRSERKKFHVLRGLVNTLSGLTWFTALSLLPLAKVTALSLSAALFTVLGAILFLGETSHWKRWAALLFGFLGVIVVVRPGYEIISLGIILVLGSRMFTAGAKLLAKALSRTEQTPTIVAYTSTTMAFLSLIPAIFVWQTPTLEQFGWLFLMGLFGTFGQLTMVQAYKLGDMGAVEPFSFVRIVWAAIFGFLFFGEIPSIWVGLGAIMIILAVSYLARDESKSKVKPKVTDVATPS